MTRRSPLVAAAVAAVLTLAACGGGDDAAGDQPADRTDAAADATPAPDLDLPAAEADLAGTTAVLGSVDLTPVTPGAGTGAHAPGLALEVTAVGYVPTIPVDAYEDITGDRIRVEPEEEPTEVRPADGHVFAVATYETRDPQWPPRGSAPRTTAQLRVQGSEVDRLFSTDDGARHTGTVVVSLPENHAPEDAVVELETHGAFQTVSLLDGKRLRSDVEHAYPGPGEVTVESAERLEMTFSHFINDREATVQGQVADAYATPFLDLGYGRGDGWAAPGQQYLAVEVDWHVTESITYLDTVVRAETPDGTAYPTLNDPSSLTDAFAREVVFQVPADTDQVTVVIESSYQNGPSSSSPVIEFDTIRAELSLD